MFRTREIGTERKHEGNKEGLYWPKSSILISSSTMETVHTKGPLHEQAINITTWKYNCHYFTN